MDTTQQHLLDQGLARWYRGRLIPVMRGAERDPLFPDIPDDLTALDDAAFDALLAESLAAKDKVLQHGTKPEVAAADPDFLGDRTATEIRDEMAAGVQNILRMQDAANERALAAQNFTDDLTSLAAQVTPEATLEASDDTGDDAGDDADTGDGDDTGDDTDTDTDTDAGDTAEGALVPEPIVAATEAPRPLRRVPPAAVGLERLGAEAYAGMAFTASAGVEPFRPGEILDGGDGPSPLNRALVAAMKTNISTPPGFKQNVIVARADITKNVPEYRRLREEDEMRNEDKIRALTAAADLHGVGYGGHTPQEAEALTASGGICAPVTPYYELAFVSSMQRPFRDSLVGFIGDRGGINYAPPPYLEQITTGVGVMTATQDADGATKTCQTLICPEFSSVDVQQIWHCFTGGNLGQRAFPEQAAQFSSLILTQHARVCETQLINQVKAGSTQVLGQSTQLGAISSLFNDVLTSAAAFRSNNRMPRDARLEMRAPQWVGDMLLIDLLQSQFDRFSKDQAGLEALFGIFNIGITFFMDGPTDGEGQVLPRQAAGYMTGFPTVVEYNITHPGGILFVDSGVLELGIVRDSVLNAENSYQVWGESFEVAVVVAVQSLWITSNVCASGSVALPINNYDQCGT